MAYFRNSNQKLEIQQPLFAILQLIQTNVWHILEIGKQHSATSNCNIEIDPKIPNYS
jgi:hypothetical protein